MNRVPVDDTTINIEGVTSNDKGQYNLQLPLTPDTPQKSLFSRSINYVQGLLSSWINPEKSVSLGTEEFIHRLLIKEQSFEPDTLYLVRTNSPEAAQPFPYSGAYEFQEHPHFGGTVDLSTIPIGQWPDKLRITGTLNLSGSSIDRLPKVLIVNGDLNISDCKNLTSLSETKTVVDGRLIARNSGLRSIQSELEAQSVDLTGSVDFSQLGSADQFNVVGDVILDGCQSLAGNIPQWLLTGAPMPDGQSRLISLQDTGISHGTDNNPVGPPVGLSITWEDETTS
ncbi:hypothetical protein [Endozoicomonas sp. ONNA2]|uniref:hypothetical protein n=1 Tax=Endozoicomonas sp. ONNA2 TaxID=2828741 RepID=UPI0021472828|nr:hypothetical protein [Endozoicomonas sp. ONNA2]